MPPPVHDAPIQGNLNGRVPLECSLEEVAEMLAVACDDDELLGAGSGWLFVERPSPHSPHELVECALAFAIPDESGRSQDFNGPRGRRWWLAGLGHRIESAEGRSLGWR